MVKKPLNYDLVASDVIQPPCASTKTIAKNALADYSKNVSSVDRFKQGNSQRRDPELSSTMQNCIKMIDQEDW